MRGVESEGCGEWRARDVGEWRARDEGSGERGMWRNVGECPFSRCLATAQQHSTQHTEETSAPA